MLIDITLTGAGGEYMETATLVSWAVAPGARVKRGDVLAVVETVKAATEIEAPADGEVASILVLEGQEVAVGALLGRINTNGPAAVPGPVRVPESAAARGPEGAQPVTPGSSPAEPDRSGDRVVASPLARRIGRENGIDLSTILGSGPGGRIKLRDLAHHMKGLELPSPVHRSVELPKSLQAGTGAAARAALCLIHGFGADRHIWRNLRPLLDERLEVVAPELPGHGQTAATGQSLEDLADAVLRELSARGIEAIHLVGHSLGGSVALVLADAGRIEVRSLCLVAPAGLGADIDSVFIDGFLSATEADSLEPLLERLVADPAALPSGYAGAILRERGAARLAALQIALAARLFPGGTQGFDLRPALTRFTGPVKLVWGLEDRIIPHRHAFGLPGHIGLHLLPGIGHLPQSEAPMLLARLIGELVRSAGGREGS